MKTVWFRLSAHSPITQLLENSWRIPNTRSQHTLFASRFIAFCTRMSPSGAHVMLHAKLQPRNSCKIRMTWPRGIVRSDWLENRNAKWALLTTVVPRYKRSFISSDSTVLRSVSFPPGNRTRTGVSRNKLVLSGLRRTIGVWKRHFVSTEAPTKKNDFPFRDWTPFFTHRSLAKTVGSGDGWNRFFLEASTRIKWRWCESRTHNGGSSWICCPWTVWERSLLETLL